jgi:hypothetical protein
MLTPARSRTTTRRALAGLATAAIVGFLITACSDPADSAGTSGMEHGAPSAPTTSHHGNMPGMADMPTGDGLAADAAGFRFTPATSSLPADQPASFQFRITGADGKPVTTFKPDQTKLMHFYLIRSDLTGFQHVHPSMSTDGTWTAALAPAQPGRTRRSSVGTPPARRYLWCSATRSPCRQPRP